MNKMISLKKLQFRLIFLSLFFIFKLPENGKRIMDTREKHMFLNQSIRFGTHKKLKYHEIWMGKEDGCGRDGADFFIRNTTQTGRKKFLFEVNTVDNYSKKCQYL